MKTLRRWTTLATLAALAPLSFADLTLHPLFGNHMVLQRDQPITIWGSADAGADVSASLQSHTERARADGDGQWEVTLPAQAAGGPATIVVRSGEERVTLNNVMFGDVWVCSGQSNMDWRLEQTDAGPEFIGRASEFTNLRLLKLERAWDRVPLDTVDTVGWRESTPTTAGRFSGVGFHFGRIVNERTDVPIGLIHTAWGGTPAESWTPMSVLEARPDVYRARLASLADYDMPEDEAQRLIDAAQREHEAFAAKAWREGIGPGEGWHERRFDDGDWVEVTMPGWADTQVAAQTDRITYNVDGIIWLRKTVELPEGVERDPGELSLARVDDYDETFVNGTLVGSTRMAEDGRSRSQRVYDIPAGVLTAGENVIAIRLMDVRSSGGVIPGESYPFELKHAAGTTPLAGAWKGRIGFDSREHGGFPRPPSHALDIGRPFRRPAVLYNAMVHPLTRLGVAGVIWYQGESNSGRGDEYRELFPDMINAWRDAWADARGEPGYELPFYFVQLPNYRQRKDEPGESSWAEIREAQRLALGRTANTGMAITIDIGDPGDIHPTNKLPVAERLARQALRDRYGQSLDPKTGPMPTNAERHGNRVVIEFDFAEGLETADGARRVEGFALAGEDGEFEWAEAYVIGERIVAVVDTIPRPTRVRYAWADNPKVNLVNAAGLPATPFELDIE